MTCENPHCCGGLVPVPRGMSSGFYAFMAPGSRSLDDGTLLMLCPRCHPPEEKEEADATPPR